MAEFGERLVRAVGNPLAALARRARSWRALLEARRQTARVLERQPTRVLVLCYGNIYRSPFVTARLQQLLAPNAAGIDIRSAGFHPVTGRPSPESFVELSRKYGAALETHRSRLIERSDVEWAEALVIMDRHNWGRLESFGPGVTDKVLWLGALVDRGPLEIQDPYGQPLDRVLAILDRMQRATEVLAARLQSGSRRT